VRETERRKTLRVESRTVIEVRRPRCRGGLAFRRSVAALGTGMAANASASVRVCVPVMNSGHQRDPRTGTV